MLDPHARVLYLEALAPPEGFVLDRAIATTFSLDLLSLLMAPLSMVFAEQQEQEALVKNPIAFLEALKRIRDRLTVFCQAGRIAVPTVDSPLYSYLEPVVFELQPPANGSFHPKVWLLRFVDADGEVLYRLLCLSRNLTFDRSWDTILTLEGLLDQQRRRGYGLNRPLADFFQALLTMETNKEIPNPVQEQVKQMADEVRRVRFDPPPGFAEIAAFVPSGIRGYARQPDLAGYNRLLVMSPFLSDKWLHLLATSGEDNILISRPESLDAVKPQVMAQVESRTRVFMMDEAAEKPESAQEQSDEPVPAEADLSGLHAKLYIAEEGWYANILTGSANATTRGFGGANVEFGVQLRGKRSQIGIDAFLAQESQKTSLRHLLQPYRRPDTPPPDDRGQRRLERALDDARQTLTEANLSLSVQPDGDQTFQLQLNAGRTFTLAQEVAGVCWPVLLNASHARSLELLSTGQPVTFQKLSLVALSSFLAIGLTAAAEEQQTAIHFVLNLPMQGLPPEREQQLLRHIVADRNQFIRYLLFLLSEGTDLVTLSSLLDRVHADDHKPGPTPLNLPLLEELVRASSRQPEKIDRIAGLIDDLKQAGDGQDLFPEEFEQIWAAFRSLRRQGETK